MIIVQVPLRVSFFGGGTDFPEFYKKYGGAVLTTAINKYIYVIVKPRFDNDIRLTYTKAELVHSIKDLKHDIVRECMKHVGISGGIEVITIGDVPSGTGLGSSSAVTVGVLKALYAYKGIETDAQQLADEACDIEINVLKKPIGIQDQYIAAFGGTKLLEFNFNEVKETTVVFNGFFENLLLFYTGITRKADKILKIQSKNIQKNIKILKKMKNMVYQIKEADEMGKMLDKTWKLKKKLAGTITNPQINRLYNRAKRAGAIGGKILGAGGGGFLLLYCPDGTKEKVRIAMAGLTEIPFAPEADGAKVLLNYRT